MNCLRTNLWLMLLLPLAGCAVASPLQAPPPEVFLDESQALAEVRVATAPTLSAAACPPTAPPATVAATRVPGAPLPIRSTATVTVTLINCSGHTWQTTDTALGSRSPTNNTYWGFNRVPLPVPVPTGKQLAMSFEIDAPIMTGVFDFSWQLIATGGVWLGNPSPPRHLQVIALRTAPTLLCTVQVPPSGGLERLVPNGTPGAMPVTAALGANDGDPGTPDGDPVTDELERCVQAALRTPPAVGQSHTVLALPAGVYRMPRPLRVEPWPSSAACAQQSTQGACAATPGCAWPDASVVSCPSSATCAGLGTQSACAAHDCRWADTPLPACNAFSGSCTASCSLCRSAPSYPLELTTADAPADVGCLARDGQTPVQCAVLQVGVQAGNDCDEAGALVTSVSDLVIDHLVIDGNQVAREAFAWDGTRYAPNSAAFACAAGLDNTGTCPGQWTRGYNGRLGNCRDCVVRYSAFLRALCGSGLAVEGSNGVTLLNNSIRYNGFHGDHDPSKAPGFSRYESLWSDGITMNSETGTDGALVQGNDFRENTDVGGIGMSRVTNALIKDNLFYNFERHTHSAIHLGDGKDAVGGCFAGTIVEGNVINGGEDHFIHQGISLGARPFHGADQNDQSHGACVYRVWSRGDHSGQCKDAPASTSRGEVHHNTVRHARAGINLAAAAGFSVHDNTVLSSGVPVVNTYRRCTHPASAFNVDPDSLAAGGNAIGAIWCDEANRTRCTTTHLSWDDACP